MDARTPAAGGRHAAMSPQGHYHVDVFRADRRFVRGFTLQRIGETALYRVCDDAGFLYPTETFLSDPASLEEALRLALAETRRHVHGPITPAFWMHALRALGYEPPRLFRPRQEIGADGRPRSGATFRWRRRSPKDAVIVAAEEDGVGIYGSPKGAWRTHFALSRWALRSLRDSSLEKPIALVRQRSPAWLRDLTFAFDVLFRVLEAAPGSAPVADVRFENPPSGFVFLESDLVPRGPDLATACAQAAIGNKVEYGRLVVNGSALPFRCDCGAQVDLWMGLPRGGEWLTRAALAAIAADAAGRHGVPLAE